MRVSIIFTMVVESVCHFCRCDISLHEDCRKSSVSEQDVGKSKAVKKSREGHATVEQAFNILAQVCNVLYEYKRSSLYKCMFPRAIHLQDGRWFLLSVVVFLLGKIGFAQLCNNSGAWSGNRNGINSRSCIILDFCAGTSLTNASRGC